MQQTLLRKIAHNFKVHSFTSLSFLLEPVKKVNSKLLDLFVFDVDLHGSCLISFLSIFFTESLFFVLFSIVMLIFGPR